jgi:hypothetical protein
MRVPFPDISAVEPSAFQITISATSSETDTTSRIPSASRLASRTASGVSGDASSARSTRR